MSGICFHIFVKYHATNLSVRLLEAPGAQAQHQKRRQRAALGINEPTSNSRLTRPILRIFRPKNPKNAKNTNVGPLKETIPLTKKKAPYQ